MLQGGSGNKTKLEKHKQTNKQSKNKKGAREHTAEKKNQKRETKGRKGNIEEKQ
jgi:hypothetical protein